MAAVGRSIIDPTETWPVGVARLPETASSDDQ